MLASLFFFLGFFFFFLEGTVDSSSSVASSIVASSVNGAAEEGVREGRTSMRSDSTFLPIRWPCMRWEFRWRMQFRVSPEKTP